LYKHTKTAALKLEEDPEAEERRKKFLKSLQQPRRNEKDVLIEELMERYR